MKIYKNKVDKQTFDILSSSVKGEFFTINKNNEFEFIKTKFKGYSVDYLYEQNSEMFIEFLEELWYQVNIKDKYNIDKIIKELSRKNL